MSHCPTSNMILASGCCPVRGLEEAGALVGLGVDGSASNDNSNLMVNTVAPTNKAADFRLVLRSME